MKKFIKITGIVVCILAVLVIVLLVAAKWLITPERVRQAVVPVAEKALNRPVVIGDINIRLFSGVSIDDMRIGMRDEKDDFAAADQVVLRYQLLPLLKKQVVIDEVRLENPKIRVIRNADGSFNFSDLLEQPLSPSEKGSDPVPETDGGGAAIDLLVNRVLIKDGVVRFTDKAAGSDGFDYEISRINGSAENISLQNAFPFKISVLLNQAPLSVSGMLDPVVLEARADLKLDDFNITDFSPYFSQHLPGRLSSARLGLKASVEAGSRFVESSGNIMAREINLALDAISHAPVENAHMGFDYDLAVDLEKKSLQIRKAGLDANGIAVNASGSVEKIDTTPLLDLELELPATGLEKILAAVSRGFVQELTSMDPAGTISAKASISGSADKPESLLKTGKINLDGIGANVSGIRPVFTGDIALSSEKISSEKLQIVLGEDKAYMDFSATDFRSVPIRILSSIQAANLNIDKLIASMEKSESSGSRDNDHGAEARGDQAGSQGSNESDKDVTVGPFDLPVYAQGRIDVKKAVYKGLVVSDVMIRYSLADNVFNMETLEAHMAEGQVKGNASVDLGVRGLSYNADFSVNDFSSDALISGVSPHAAGSLDGKTSASLKLSGKGTAWTDIQKALSGDGIIMISEGKIAENALIEGLTRVLGVKDLKSIDFDSFEGGFKIDGGRIKLDSGLDGKNIKMRPSGTIGLDGSLDMNLNLSLAPGFSSRLSQDSVAARLLADEQGWTRLPVALGGSFLSPQFKLDSAQIQEQIQQKATQEVIEKGLRKLFE